VAELKERWCIFGFKMGSPRTDEDKENARPLPSYLDKKASERYFEAAGNGVYVVREATATISFTYAVSPEIEHPSDMETLASELEETRDGKILSWKEKKLGYKCEHESCENCPCLVDKDVYVLLRARKKK